MPRCTSPWIVLVTSGGSAPTGVNVRAARAARSSSDCALVTAADAVDRTQKHVRIFRMMPSSAETCCAPDGARSARSAALLLAGTLFPVPAIGDQKVELGCSRTFAGAVVGDVDGRSLQRSTLF